MAVTGLRVKGVNVQITTQIPHESENLKGTMILITKCDEDFLPTSVTSKTYNEREELDFIKHLRINAAEKEQLITNYSTNPELNPEGYVKNYKSEIDDKK